MAWRLVREITRAAATDASMSPVTISDGSGLLDEGQRGSVSDSTSAPIERNTSAKAGAASCRPRTSQSPTGL